MCWIGELVLPASVSTGVLRPCGRSSLTQPEDRGSFSLKVRPPWKMMGKIHKMFCCPAGTETSRTPSYKMLWRHSYARQRPAFAQIASVCVGARERGPAERERWRHRLLIGCTTHGLAADYYMNE